MKGNDLNKDEAEDGAGGPSLPCSRAKAPSGAGEAGAARETGNIMQPGLRHPHGPNARAGAPTIGPLEDNRGSRDCSSSVGQSDVSSKVANINPPPTRAARAPRAAERLPPPGGEGGAGTLACGMGGGNMACMRLDADAGMAKWRRAAALGVDAAAEFPSSSAPSAMVEEWTTEIWNSPTGEMPPQALMADANRAEGSGSTRPARRRALGEVDRAQSSDGCLPGEGGALTEAVAEEGATVAAAGPAYDTSGGSFHGPTSGERSKRRRLRGKQAIAAETNLMPLFDAAASSSTALARRQPLPAEWHNSVHEADSAGPSRPTSHLELHRLALRGGRHGQVLRARPPEFASGPGSERATSQSEG